MQGQGLLDFDLISQRGMKDRYGFLSGSHAGPKINITSRYTRGRNPGNTQLYYRLTSDIKKKKSPPNLQDSTISPPTMMATYLESV